MKHCPTCGSSYTDDTLVYCLQDGATLHRSGGTANPLSMAATLRGETPADASATESLNASSARTVKIEASALPTSPHQGARVTARPVAGPARATQPANSTRVVITTVAVTLLLVTAAGVGAWLLFRRGGEDGQGPGARAPQANAANATANAANPPANVTANAATSATPAPANAPETGNQTRRASTTAGTGDKGGRWFVILGSFPKEEREQAAQRVEMVRRQGFDASLVSSDHYPNMKPGLWVVVMGPYTRTNAEEVLADVKPKVKDAYTKSGW